MRYQIKISILLFFLWTCCVNAQTKKLDSIVKSLRYQIEQAASDSIKVPLMIKLSNELGAFDVETACDLDVETQKIIDNNLDNSRYFQKLKVQILQSRAYCGIVQGNLTEALDYQQQALDLSIKIKDSLGISRAYTGRGTIALKKHDTINAKYNYKLAVEILEKNDNSYDLAYTYIKLGHVYNRYRKLDSARYFYRLAKTVHPTNEMKVTANANIGTSYIFEDAHDKAIEVLYENLKILDSKNYTQLSSVYNNLASSYTSLKRYEDALQSIDRAISYSKKVNDKIRIRDQYEWKYIISARAKKFENAFDAHKSFKIYSDSLNDTNEIKRFTELELTYKFDKEKELAAVELKSEASKKKLYFILLLITALLGAVLIFFIRKNNKQKLKLAANEIELKKVEKLKADLALANRETELKKVVVENSITEEVLNKTLDDIKEIITFTNEKERKTALRSLSANLLSEKLVHKNSTSVQSYLDNVNIDFKIRLDTHFSQLKPKEKEFLCLMKIGLNTAEISKLQNTTIPAVKSYRYRMRKKMGLDSNTDIIAYIDSKGLM
jgi:DNA-binding CsgD family transcriptional regulator/tetratricopeptide (TPR) repeat protein